MKHLVKNKRNTLQKFNSILKLHSPSSYSKQSMAPQIHTSLNTNSQISNKQVTPESLISRKKLPFLPQLTLSDSIVNPQLNIPFALQMPLKIRRSQFVPSNRTTNNSHSINKFAANQCKCQTIKNVNTLNR